MSSNAFPGATNGKHSVESTLNSHNKGPGVSINFSNVSFKLFLLLHCNTLNPNIFATL